MVKLGEFVNRIVNKKTKQERLDLKKLKLKEWDIDVDEILNAEIKAKRKKRGIF